jgi:hypothetical protein
MRPCSRHVEPGSPRDRAEFRFGATTNLFRFISLFAIQEKNVAGEEVSNQVSPLRRLNLYEKPIVPYDDKIVRVKEFVVAVDIGRFWVRLGANGWI